MGCTGTKLEDREKNRLVNTGLEKALVNISCQGKKGYGFLCKLLVPDSATILPALITSTLLIGKKEIEELKEISFNLENENYTIKIDDQRKTYINEDKYNVAIIEIKNEDNLSTNNFFEVEEKEKPIKNNSIGVITINDKENYLEYFICKIKGINENGYSLEYICEDVQVNKSIGNPVINIKNNRILGFQNKSGSCILLNQPIKDFVEADIRKEKENKSIYQSLKKTFTLKSTIRIDEAKLNNEIGILYLLPDVEDIDVLKIFGEQFVKNNKDKCSLILYDSEKDEEYKHDLCAYLDLDYINSINSGKRIFKLFLVQTDYFYDLSYMFYQCYTLMGIEGLESLYYDQVINMNSMFHSCALLVELNMAKINTSQVENVSFMFEKCVSLEYLDLSGWDTSNIKTTKAMFELCGKLEEIEGLGDWNLSSLKDASYMFNLCKNLEKFSGIEKWNTSSINDMANMFKGLESVTDFPDISNWDLKNVRDISAMFCSCLSITSLPDISKWNTEKVETIYGLFYGCSELTKIPDISKWNLSNVISIEKLFHSCTSLISLPDLSKWDTKNVENMSHVFCKCNSLKSLPDLSKWEVGKVKDFTLIFAECSSLKSLPDLSNWDVSNAESIRGFFTVCEALESICDLSKWNVKNVKDFGGVFENCRSITSLPDI